MRTNVNEIRLSALLFDERVAVSKEDLVFKVTLRLTSQLVVQTFPLCHRYSSKRNKRLAASCAQEEEIEPNLPASTCANAYRRRLSSRTGCWHLCGEP